MSVFDERLGCRTRGARRAADRRLRARRASHDVQLALEPRLRAGRVGAARAPLGDEHLLDVRPRGARRGAKRAVVDRQDAPADHLEPFFACDLLEQASKLLALVMPVRRKTSPTPYCPAAAARYPADGHLPEKTGPHLNEHARAVTRVRLRSRRHREQQVDEDLQPCSITAGNGVP